MNRRSLLLSIGAASVGTGAVFGSGAFTSIEADRNVDLNVSSDSGSAQVSFDKGSGVGAGTIIGTDTSESVDVIKFEETNLNERAKTTFTDALEIDNNGSNTVNLYVDGSTDGVGDDPSNGDVLDFRVDDASIVGDGTSGNAIELGPDGNGGQNADVVEVDIVVDLLDDNVDGSSLDDIESVTFVVEATNN
ncbi:TafE family fimbrial adapter protein [Haloferax larsenii]|uniref:Uncharacterized protein n=1 Tax=Haloferax larsenii TaxID=302484 RepID=A0A1H7TA06_HALLR|nr:hypothetical protein [Haloferax larsenii]UVE52178.1 hypothetical protein KU306_16325 [Haloferax larsenii]SEL81339.1 hypothetical protein SAMN04488691_108123 [Haloferax larsenii]